MEGPDSNIEGIEKLRDATLVFLVKKDGERITGINLAMKKRSFGAGRWNGAGGKVEQGESIDEATQREVKEEIGVEIVSKVKVAELSFYFPHNPAWNQMVHVYFSEDWGGEPTESEEMRPEWFSANEMPYDSMWPSDAFWVPEVLAGKKVRGTVVFGEGDVVLSKEIYIVDEL